MNPDNLSQIAQIMEQYGLTSLKLNEKDVKLEITRGQAFCAPAGAMPMPMQPMPAPMPAMPPMPAAAPAPAAMPAPCASPAAEAEAAAPMGLSTADGTPVDSSRVTEVCAPMVGVFYAAPAPGAEPFVRKGAKVKKGDTLCILEAMKLMNEVAAECDGEVVEVCVGDGELVEYGRVLFRIY